MTSAPQLQRGRRELTGLLSAQAVAWTGTRMSALALPWFVLTTTGSAARTGIVVLAEMGPYVVCQLLSGPVIDRVGPRRISITGDLASMAVVAVVPLLYAAGLLHFWALLPIVAVVGAFRGPADASKSVLVPDATRAAGMPLERGTGLAATIERLASTVGPAAAGVVVAAAGGPYALVVTAALFGAGAVLIATTTLHRAAPLGEPEPYLRRLRHGAAFLRRDRLLRSIALMIAVTNLLDAAWASVLLPSWARENGHGPAVVGLLVGVMGACAVVSSLLAAAVAHRLRRRPVFLIGFVVAGAPRFAVLAFDLPLWLIVGVHAVAGLGSGFLNPILGAIQFERTPRDLFGRVRTLVVAVAWSGIPFGGLIGGGLIALVGVAPSAVAAGTAYLVTTAAAGLRKEWADMDRQRRRPDGG